MTEDKKSFPMLPVAHWWELRKKFKQSIPGVVTDSYIATVLGMQVGSARGNVLPYLKQIGIIDDEGKTLDRAKLWRDDGRYPDVCKAIVKEVYPAELLDAVPDPKTNRGQAERWFAHSTGTGQVAVRRMAGLYEVLVEADPSKQPDKDKKEKPQKEKQRKAARPVGGATSIGTTPAQPAASGATDNSAKRQLAPEININLQVHISADATPDQIDQIFASMAKHIYQRD